MQPSQVGIELSSLGFETFVGDVMIAPVSSSGKVSLAPGSTSDLSLVGRLVPQTSSIGLSTVSDVFNNFVQGKDSNVTVRGANAGSKDVCFLQFQCAQDTRGLRSLGGLAQRRD